MAKRKKFIFLRVILLSVFLALILTAVFFCYNIHISNLLTKEEKFLAEPSIRDKLTEIRNDGNTPAILLIHSFGDSPYDVKPLCDALKIKGFAFHAVLLPGHGTNPKKLQNIKMLQLNTASRGVRFLLGRR